MCVIYTCNTKLPDDAELKRGATRNSDGAGVAWLTSLPEEGGKLTVQWQKGLKDDEEVKKFIKDQNIPFPLVIHFRTASVGGVSAGLTHPFPTIQDVPLWTAGQAPEVLFHNGHLSNWDDLVLNVGLPSTERFPDGVWSDTRALAWLTYLKGPGILDFIVKSSRVALMHADANTESDETYDKSLHHITHFGSGWIHHEGYSQSISTGNYGGVVTRSGYYYKSSDELPIRPDLISEDDEEERAWSESFGSVGNTSTPTTHELTPNVWTMEELNAILTDLEGEQAGAKLAAGV
jgi:hypothetical protein